MNELHIKLKIDRKTNEELYDLSPDFALIKLIEAKTKKREKSLSSSSSTFTR